MCPVRSMTTGWFLQFFARSMRTEEARAEGRPLAGLLTMPTVQNPRGFVTPLTRREESVAISREFNLKIIEDDAYGNLVADAPPNYAVLAPERTFYVRGLAKSFSPAVRTGFLVAPESAEAAVVMSLKNTATGSDVLQNLAALAMCEDGTVNRVMEHKRVEGAIRNKEAHVLLGAAAAPGARCAWHVWVRLGEGVEGRDVVEAMKKVDVLISPGGFVCGGAGVRPGSAAGAGCGDQTRTHAGRRGAGGGVFAQSIAVSGLRRSG